MKAPHPLAGPAKSQSRLSARRESIRLGTELDRHRRPDGQEMWGRFIYREIVEPERMVYVVSFSDPKGGMTRHFLSPEWPLEMLNTATFTEEGGKTTLTLHSVAINATAHERKLFEDGFKSMEGGYTGTLDQLEAHLAKTA